MLMFTTTQQGINNSSHIDFKRTDPLEMNASIPRLNPISRNTSDVEKSDILIAN